MQMKNILKSLFLTTLYTSVYAVKDDCKELGSLLKDAMTRCKMNDNGEMIELAYNTFNEEVTEEGYKKALSYPTLKKLHFGDQYGDCSELLYGLTNLKNLEELSITSYRGCLVQNTLKGLTSLKKFAFNTGEYIGSLTKENLEELGTLTNLESLSFSFVSLEPQGLKAFQNLNKVTSLTLECGSLINMDVGGCLDNLKNVKELTVSYNIQDQVDMDSITSYTNLEKLAVGISKEKNINCDNMKNLTKLHTLDLYIYDVDEVPSCVKGIPNLKKLTYNEKEIPLQNGNNTNQTTGNNANQTNGNNANQTNENNTNQTNGNNTNQATGNDTNQAVGNNTNQAVGNNVNQAVGNDVNQSVGNNVDQITENITNGNTATTTGPNDDIDIDSGVGSTIVHAINFLPVIALVFGMLL